MTNIGVFHAYDEPRVHPDMLSYGVNICFIPAKALEAVKHTPSCVQNNILPILSVQMARNGATHIHDVPITEDACNDFKIWTSEGLSAGEKRCYL